MIKCNTKEIRSAYERYRNIPKRTLYEVYKKPSSRKQTAWTYCMNLCEEHDGFQLKVIGHNCYYFSAGFIFDEDGKRYFCWITEKYDRYLEIDD